MGWVDFSGFLLGWVELLNFLGDRPNYIRNQEIKFIILITKWKQKIMLRTAYLLNIEKLQYWSLIVCVTFWSYNKLIIDKYEGRIGSWVTSSVVSGSSVVERRFLIGELSLASWLVTTYMGKSSAVGQLTRPTQPFHPHGVDKWVVSYNQIAAVTRTGGAAWWMLTR